MVIDSEINENKFNFVCIGNLNFKLSKSLKIFYFLF